MKTAITQPTATLEKKKTGLGITILINITAIFIIGTLVFIFGDSLKSNTTYIQGLAIIAFFSGQVSAILIFHVFNKKNQKLEQDVHVQHGENNAGDKKGCLS